MKYHPVFQMFEWGASAWKRLTFNNVIRIMFKGSDRTNYLIVIGCLDEGVQIHDTDDLYLIKLQCGIKLLFDLILTGNIFYNNFFCNI